MTLADQRRFWALTDHGYNDTPCGCILWLGADDGRHGHGKFAYRGKSVRAIRWVCELFAPGCLSGRYRRRVVRHVCDVPLCVRPDHLIPGTQKQNVRDAMQRGRHKIPRRSEMR